MSARTRRYHHGNLRAALIDAAVEMARAGGPEAVVVREASRRVGVSHNAAYRHFPDRDQLLKAVCGRCMSALARLMEAGIARVPGDDHSIAAARARLRATGVAYVTFALTEPGWFRTAFAVPHGLSYLDEHEGAGESGLGPYELLSAQLDALAAAGGLPLERRDHAEIAAWSAVHGLATLLIDGPLREMPEAERVRAAERVLDTVERGLESV
jgi:AcrR family transcriptional regulator